MSATRCTACAARSPAAACSSLPSFVLLCVMSGIYVEFGDVTVVEGVVSGLGAAVVALVAAAVIRVGSRVIHTPAAVGLAAIAFLAIAVGVPFPIIIALAAALGYLAGRSNPRHARSAGRPRQRRGR